MRVNMWSCNYYTAMLCSICQKKNIGGGIRCWRCNNRGAKSAEEGVFLHFKIVNSDAFLYTNSQVSFAIKCKERYVITVFLANDGDKDTKTASCHQSCKLIPDPIQRLATISQLCMCYRPEIVLYELQMQATL